MANRISVPVKAMALMRSMSQAELGVLLDLAIAEFRPKAKNKPLTKTKYVKGVVIDAPLERPKPTPAAIVPSDEPRHPGDKLRLRRATGGILGEVGTAL